ncbi:MAG: hypothetical protein U0T84_08780 [Chitinophagales bacterium]
MKKVWVILLIAFTLLQHVVGTGLQVYYSLNRQYYVEKLCENRNRPEMHCNGKCYLSRQLKKAEEGSRKLFSLQEQLQEYILSSPQFKLTVLTKERPFQFLPYRSDLTVAEQNALLKPPCAKFSV